MMDNRDLFNGKCQLMGFLRPDPNKDFYTYTTKEAKTITFGLSDDHNSVHVTWSIDGQLDTNTIGFDTFHGLEDNFIFGMVHLIAEKNRKAAELRTELKTLRISAWFSIAEALGDEDDRY